MREDPLKLNPTLSNLIRMLQNEGVRILIHPHSKRDLSNDHNKGRLELILSKIGSYPEIQNPPEPDLEFLENMGVGGNPHDLIDANILYSVKQDIVDFLISEDRKLLHRANKVELGDRVMDFRTAFEFFSHFFRRNSPPTPPYVLSGVVSDLVKYLQTEFFDSFRTDYSEFDEWFRKIARDRNCYYIKENNTISALMILKKERESLRLGEFLLPDLERLKICSLKVADSQANVRVFEKFLSLAFFYALSHGLKSVYVTVFEKHHSLIDHLKRYGFVERGTLWKTNEKLLEKSMNPEPIDDPFMYLKKYYPNFRDDSGIEKYIIPVKPYFHKQLFPEYSTKQHSLLQYDSRMPVSNAIVKVYLSKSRINKITPGDVVLFYRSREERGVTSIGVVEETKRSSSFQEIIDFVGNRSVYSSQDISDLTISSSVLGIKFWLVKHLDKLLTFNDMKKSGVIVPQSISHIGEDTYKKISLVWRLK